MNLTEPTPWYQGWNRAVSAPLPPLASISPPPCPPGLLQPASSRSPPTISLRIRLQKPFKADMLKEAGRRDHLRPHGRFLQELLGRLGHSRPPKDCAVPQDWGTDMATQQRKSLKEMSNHAQFLTLMEAFPSHELPGRSSGPTLLPTSPRMDVGPRKRSQGLRVGNRKRKEVEGHTLESLRKSLGDTPLLVRGRGLGYSASPSLRQAWNLEEPQQGRWYSQRLKAFILFESQGPLPPLIAILSISKFLVERFS